MSRYNLAKLGRYIPLWRREIPKYPLWFRNGPQLRIALPLFWMKLINREHRLPENQVCFEVHPQMTKYDVKNYLEKIYKIPVNYVNFSSLRGEEQVHQEGGFLLRRDPDKKYAFVRLGEGQTYNFPDFYAEKESHDKKNMKDLMKANKEMEKDRMKSWTQQDVPEWFR